MLAAAGGGAQQGGRILLAGGIAGQALAPGWAWVTKPSRESAPLGPLEQGCVVEAVVRYTEGMQHDDGDPDQADEPRSGEDEATSLADDGLAPLINNTGADDAPGGDADAPSG